MVAYIFVCVCLCTWSKSSLGLVRVCLYDSTSEAHVKAHGPQVELYVVPVLLEAGLIGLLLSSTLYTLLLHLSHT